MTASDFWDRPQDAQATVERLKVLKKVVDPWHKAHQTSGDLLELIGMMDEHQGESLKELQEDVAKLAREVELLEFQRLLSGPFDPKSLFLFVGFFAVAAKLSTVKHKHNPMI